MSLSRVLDMTPVRLRKLIANLAAKVHTHVATDLSDSTATGRALITAADAAAGRTTLAAAPTASPVFTGDVTIGGDIIIPNAGRGTHIKEGSNARMGIAVLVGGTVAVSNTSVTADSRIFITNNKPAGTVGFCHISARVPGTSFTITSSNALDTSEIAWIIFEPA